jgi:hypothetical protein
MRHTSDLMWHDISLACVVCRVVLWCGASLGPLRNCCTSCRLPSTHWHPHPTLSISLSTTIRFFTEAEQRLVRGGDVWGVGFCMTTSSLVIRTTSWPSTILLLQWQAFHASATSHLLPFSCIKDGIIFASATSVQSLLSPRTLSYSHAVRPGFQRANCTARGRSFLIFYMIPYVNR